MNYFIHTGHLHIEGLKMSKSLKNFITIDVSCFQRRKPQGSTLLTYLRLPFSRKSCRSTLRANCALRSSRSCGTPRSTSQSP